MKKLLIFLMTIFGVFGLASCSSNEVDYTLDQTSREKAIYKSWIKDVEFDSTKIPMEGQGYQKTDTRYEIFLPTDIEGSSRYAAQSIEEAYSDSNKSVKIGYWSLFNLANVSHEICKQVSKGYDETVKNAYTKVTPVDYTKQWFTDVDIKGENGLEFVEGKERGISVLYFPVKIMFYLAKDGSDALPKIETFAIVPVYYEVGYLVDGTPESTVFANFPKADLKIGSNGMFEGIEK